MSSSWEGRGLSCAPGGGGAPGSLGPGRRGAAASRSGGFWRHRLPSRPRARRADPSAPRPPVAVSACVSPNPQDTALQTRLVRGGSYQRGAGRGRAGSFQNLGFQPPASLPLGPSPILGWGGTLTQVSYMLSGFSFLRVDLEETVTAQWAREKDAPPSRVFCMTPAASGSSLGHRRLVAQSRASGRV